MKAMYLQKSDGMDFIAPRDILSGEVLCFGNIVGIVKLATKAGRLGTLCLNGIYDIDKGQEAIAMGSEVFWNEKRGVATACREGNKYLGVAVLGATLESWIVRIALNYGKHLETSDYTAFDVFPTDHDIAAGTLPEDLPDEMIPIIYEGRSWFELSDAEKTESPISVTIPAQCTHAFNIRSEKCRKTGIDVVVDWGDGTVTELSDENAPGVIASERKHPYTYIAEDPEDMGESTYTLFHTYKKPNRVYTVKIYGKDYYAIVNGIAFNGEEDLTKYNLLCRCWGINTPIASHLYNLSSFARRALRLFYVYFQSYTDSRELYNTSNAFIGCRNLRYVRGFGSQSIICRNCANMFSSCPALRYSDFRLPSIVLDKNAFATTYGGCKSLQSDITTLLPKSGFIAKKLDFQAVFSGSKITGTVPADILWKDKTIQWSNTERAFASCPAEIRSQVPISWGGTASDDIINQ